MRAGVLLLSNDSMLLLHAEGSTGNPGNSKVEGDLYDYKLFRFSDGRVITLAMTDRFTGGLLSRTFFDEEWNVLPISEGNHPTRSEIPKPRAFESMKAMTRQLGVGLPFVRVDFYECSGRLYFGEITFYPNSGFECFNPPVWNKKFGDLIDLRLAYDSD